MEADLVRTIRTLLGAPYASAASSPTSNDAVQARSLLIATAIVLRLRVNDARMYSTLENESITQYVVQRVVKLLDSANVKDDAEALIKDLNILDPRRVVCPSKETSPTGPKAAEPKAEAPSPASP